MTAKPVLTVRIKHGDREVEFVGDREEVWIAVNKYFSETLGPIELVSKLTGEVDVSEIAAKLNGKVVIREREINVLTHGDNKRRIILCLAGGYVGKRLGLLENDFLSPKEISSILHIDENVARARLSELWKSGFVDRDENGRYRFKPFTAIKLIE
ncbi:MAG: hypothetical protein RMH74_08755 [Candidatus Caldarchaeum sp.]|nr:hypothetical protein [Candidatus Caldarchaeum sp.]